MTGHTNGMAPSMRAHTPRAARALGWLLLVVAFGSPRPADGQPAPTVFQIGYLGNSTLAAEAPLVEGLRQGLRELGYVEGKNIVVHSRWAEGRGEQLVRLASELVLLEVNVIVTAGTPAGQAAGQATKTVPIVLAAAGDPIEAGLASSLSRPGGNVT